MQKRDERVAVYGLGYVGLTLCAAWLKIGYKVLGVDVLRDKIKALNSLSFTHIEAEVKHVIAEAISKRHFRATWDSVGASERSRVKIIAIPVGLDEQGLPVLKNLVHRSRSHNTSK